MAQTDLMTLVEKYGDEKKAREFLEALRWPHGPICPHCGVVDRAYRLTPRPGSKTRAGLWKCRDCRKPFSVTVGTVMEDSHIKLSKWVIAIHLLAASKKGMSAHQLHRMLGISYKAAWFLAHRIRYAMSPSQHDKLRGTVEVDETYIGGKVTNRLRRMGKSGRGPKDKLPVVALVERGGRVRSIVMPKVTGVNLRGAIREHVAASARIMTDDLQAYKGLNRRFRSHETVNHSRDEYVRGQVHTNTVEGFFSILKRGINGVYHHVGQYHLGRYLAEFDFRHNHRMALGYSDGERARLIVRAVAGKRLMFQPSGAA